MLNRINFVLFIQIILLVIITGISRADELTTVEINCFGQKFKEPATISDSGKLYISINLQVFKNICKNTSTELRSFSKKEFKISRNDSIAVIENDIADETFISAYDLAEACSCFYSFEPESEKCIIAPKLSSIEITDKEIIIKSGGNISKSDIKTKKDVMTNIITLKNTYAPNNIKIEKKGIIPDNITITSKNIDNDIITEISINSPQNIVLKKNTRPNDNSISIATERTGATQISNNNTAVIKENKQDKDNKKEEKTTPANPKNNDEDLITNTNNVEQTTQDDRDKNKNPYYTSSIRVATIPIPKTAEGRRKAISLQKQQADEAIKISLHNQISLDSLDIETFPDRLELKINTSDAFSYKWLRMKIPDNRFIIDIQACKMNLKQKEYILTSSIADKIRSAQFEPGPDGASRIVVDLKKPSKFDIVKNSNTSVTFKFYSTELSPSMLVMSGYGYTDKKAIQYDPDGITICIDPGHGGGDFGAVNNRLDLAEKDLTLSISLKLAELLRKKGFNIIMTRETDRDVSYKGSPDNEELGARVKAGQKADIFVSIHINAATNTKANGISVHWYKAVDKELAKNIQFALIGTTGRTDRGISQDNFFVVSKSKMPAVLAELGFISNDDEAKLLNENFYQQKIAEAIADGIDVYVGQNMKSKIKIKK
ncbi:N-acetylmuramoyl-L-alanine amidase [bacterium]|nr:N-acetylmuramoyl-L-alanine amidase [bacterium]